MLLKYHELIGQSKEEAESLFKSKGMRDLPKDDLFFMMVSHYDLRSPAKYIFDAEEIAVLLDVEEEIIEKTLSYFSYGFGDLAEDKKEFFFLENPIWSKPVIALKGGYYCSMPQLFFSFILNTLDNIVEGINKASLHDRRSKFLERKIESIVKTRFPESQVLSGVKWDLDGTQYETDLIAIIDSHLIIIEAKSQKISKPALRGAPARIKRHLEEILIEPGIQSHRLEQKLNNIRKKGSSDDPLNDKLPVDINSIKNILRVSVSLEDFATLQTNLRFFNDTEWLPDDFSPCPSINLADFETLFDFLEHPVQIIHYLQRRTELEGEVNFIGDELDFMGLYITTLFNVEGMLTDDNIDVAITGMSEPLDKYYISKDHGVLIEKPQPNISTFFKKIFDKLEERAIPRWTEIGAILNRFPPDDQNKLSRYIETLTASVHKTWKVEGHKNIAIYSPPESSEYSLSVVLYKNGNSDRRYEFFEHAAALGLETQHVRFCLVIGINIDRNDLPYHYTALSEAPSTE